MIDGKQILYSKLHSNDIEETKLLIGEYIRSLHIDLSFQDIDNELQSFPHNYDDPDAAFLIAKHENIICGCVGLKKIDTNICEMKRLYVRDEYKGHGIGKELIKRILEEAKNKGYKKMRLDTLKEMKKAQELYRQFSFYEIEPYVYNPIEGTVFMEKILS